VELNVTADERKQIAAPAADLLVVAQGFKVVTVEGYEAGAEKLKLIKAAQKALAEKKKSVMDPIRETQKAALALFAEPEAALEQSEGLIKRAMIGFQEEQERQRAEAQRKLDEAAAAERRRQEKAAEEARQKAEAARAAGKDAVADRAEAKAEAAQAAAATVVAPTVQVSTPRVGGISMRENWYAVVTDVAALTKAVAEGTVPQMALEPNMKFLNNQAKALKKELRYPGVSAAMDKGIAAGSK
jgi:hypothetical protein